MQSLAASSGGLHRIHRVVSIISITNCLSRSSFVRGDATLISAACALSNGDPLASRFVHEPLLDHAVLKHEKLHTRGYATKVTLGETHKENVEEIIIGSNLAGRGIKEVTKIIPVANSIWHATILPYSSHRNGTIYKERLYWKQNYGVDIADRNETRVDPMRYTVSTDCNPDPENCYHLPCEMTQIFSLKLAKIPMNGASVQLYGYIAARDDVDSMLNYVFHRTRDDPIIVHQDALIEMTGPKRGIALISYVLFEFDMRIKNGEQEQNDVQLIDGVTEFHEIQMPWTPFTYRINGEHGAVDMCLANVYNGVEATVEVVVTDMQNGFDLSISSVVSMLEVCKEFQLFGGTIGQPCGLRRFVVAVLLDTVLHLKFKLDRKCSNVAEYCCSFEAKLHGAASLKIKHDIASILVKVTWSPLIE